MPVAQANKYQTVSAIPGRIRLQIAREARNHPVVLQELAILAAELAGGAEVGLALDALSLVVRYPPTARPLQEVVKEFEAMAHRVISKHGSTPAGEVNAVQPPSPASVAKRPALRTQAEALVRTVRTMPVFSAKSSVAAERSARMKAIELSEQRESNGKSAQRPTPNAQRPTPNAQRPTPNNVHVELKHFFPGRIRLHMPKLRKNSRLASEFEQHLLRVPGVTGVEASPDSGFVIVRYNAETHKSVGLIATVRQSLMSALVSLAGADPQNPRISSASHQELGKDLIKEPKAALNPLIFPTLSIAVSAVGGLPIAVIGGALVLASLPTAVGALEGARQRRFNVAQLDLCAIIALSFLGQFTTGGIMTWLIGLGELIRLKTMRRSKKAISELMSPAGQSAWVECDGTVLSIPLDRIKSGDVVVAYPGDQIPVDGVVIDGRALVDQKLLTGESVPVAKGEGDAVFALTIISDGQIRIRVEHIGSDTRAGRVVEMIENAPLSDTRVSNYAAKVGDRLVPGIFLLAGGVFFVTADLARMASILILDFVTGIQVSAPTTILSAMTGAAKQGVFIKGGKAMENLADIDAIVFDKTGTLTHGSPFVTEVLPTDATLTPDKVLSWAAAAEANLKHPAAKAIVDAAVARGLDIPPLDSMEYVMGMGVASVVEGRALHVGSQRYMKELGVDLTRATSLIDRCVASANSMVFCAMDGRLIGLVAYTDPPRPESAEVIQALRDRGVKRIVMLTGDNRRAADVIASQLGITDIIADAFPEQKADVVSALREEGYKVAVIGDGINDSPAFTRADVGISLQHGADVAKETADVILLDGSLHGLPRAIDLSREAIAILKQNVNIIIAPTVVGMAAAAVGLSNPLISTLINNGTTVITGVNALRPMFPPKHKVSAAHPKLIPMISAAPKPTETAAE